MTEYRYIVPNYFHSPWSGTGPVTSGDINEPRVGVYCPHDPHPWLCGSLCLDSELSDRTDADYWAWSPDYLTGDGFLIRLGRKAHGVSNTQFIVDDAPRDRAAEKIALRVAAETGNGVADALALRDYAEANTRARVTMRCEVKNCGISRTFRVERLHSVASKLWSVGIREIPLLSFAARVDRTA